MQTQTIQTQQQAIQTLARYFKADATKAKAAKDISIGEFSADRFYIPETGDTLTCMPHQEAILDYALSPNNPFVYGGTIIYSTVKKSGKTAISSLVARYIAETWGTSNELYMVANDMEQARGRAYQKLLDSIEIDPQYEKKVARNGWKIIERAATYEPNRSIVKALSNDYRGEAGSNPTATFWSELWGYTSDASRRLWEELTPVPTRERGIRYVETYAGFTDESDLLLELYQLGLSGRRLTHDDIDWPYDDQPPIYVNEKAHMFMYWDDNKVARRMPWQTEEYYSTQAATLRPAAFDRLHLNLWTSSTESFLPIEWWNACRGPLPPLGSEDTIVIGVDASVSGDCTAIVGVTRDPFKPGHAMVRFYHVWYPSQGSPIDLAIIDAKLRELCANYNVVQLAYDQFQLHKLMTDITHDGIAWCRVFGQTGTREVADKQLYDMIRDRQLTHNCGPEFDDHIKGAAAKIDLKNPSKMRIVKKTNQTKVDLIVATSMAVAECMRLNLD